MLARATQFSSASANGSTYNFNSRLRGSVVSGRYTPYTKDFVGLFYENLRRWESETAFLSDAGKITQHECYKALVTLAPNTLREIAAELAKTPSHLVWVLEDAFNEQPYSDEDTGAMGAMTQGWIRWINSRGEVD